MSEKMDGVRAYWNGSKLISKHGKTFECPKWFTEHLPLTPYLDGELWMGRESTFTSITAILNATDGAWNQIGYYEFDIPSSDGTYEDRMKEMDQLKSRLPAHVHIVENIQCRGNDHPQEYL